MSRRGFLKAFGLGGAAAAGVSAGVVDPLKILTQSEGLDIVEMLKSARSELVNEGLLDAGVNKSIEGASAKVWSYDDLLNAVKNRQDLSAAQRKIVEAYSKELKAAYSKDLINYNRSKSKKISNEKAQENTYIALVEVLKVRSLLSIELLRRIAWQWSYPEDLMLKRLSGENDIHALRTYKSSMLQLVLDKESLVRQDPILKAYVLYQVSEIQKLLELPAVKDWIEKGADYTENNYSTGSSCSRIL